MSVEMSIIERLLNNSTRRDEKANVELAEEIVKNNDFQAVHEIAENLGNKKLQSDCIKILYEIAERKPELAADYTEKFFELLNHKNNRLVWGAMTAIDAVSALRSELVYSRLDELRDIAEQGSVITRDHLVNILIKLAPTGVGVFSLLIDQLAACPPNQLPMYAERAFPLFEKENKAEFVAILSNRKNEMKTESKKKRLEKIIKKLS